MKPDFSHSHDQALVLSRMAGGLQGSEILRIAGEIQELQAGGREILNLTVGDFSPQEFRIPDGLEALIVRALEAGETHYPPATGVPALRQAVARLFARDLDLAYPVESVLIAGGARPLIYASYLALVDPGDTVVYPVPSWNNDHYVHQLGARGIAVPSRPEARFMPEAEMLAPHLREARLLALCSPLNPTGTAFTAQQLTEICDLVLAENARRGRDERPLYVLYDQVYWSLTFGGTRHVTPVGLRPAMAPYVVFADGASKAFAATGLRVGWGVGPPEVIRRMGTILAHVGAWAPRAEQVAVAGFLDDPRALGAWRKTYRAGLESRLEALASGFAALAAAGLPVRHFDPMGAIYLTVQIDVLGRRTPAGALLETNEDVRRYVLDAAGVAVVPFRSFAYPGETGWFRLSVGAAGVESIERAMPRLAEALHSLRE